MDRYPFFRQLETSDCGPACLRMLAKYIHIDYSPHFIKSKCNISITGMTLFDLREAAISLGFKCVALKMRFSEMRNCSESILLLNNSHYVVLYKIKKGNRNDDLYLIADPAIGKYWISQTELSQIWSGITLQFDLKHSNLIFEEKSCYNFKYYLRFITKYKSSYVLIFLALIASSFVQLIISFFTQNIVDIGVKYKDISFIKLLLSSLFLIYTTQLVVNVLKNWLSLHMSFRVFNSLYINFIKNVFNLPLQYFESRKAGDILQKMSDVKSIGNLFTGSYLSISLAVLNFILFALILNHYSSIILIIFGVAQCLNLISLYIYLNLRKRIDYMQFYQSAKSQNQNIQMISAIADIKLNNREQDEINKWQDIQYEQIKLSIRSQIISNWQTLFSSILIHFSNICMTFVAAELVLSGELTIGSMMAISYIIGQLSLPMSKFIVFMQSVQGASIAMERLKEIYSVSDSHEETSLTFYKVPRTPTITVKNLSFAYNKEKWIFSDLNFFIPPASISAIVGISGCGKSTFIKILMMLYAPNKGDIFLDQISLKHISHKSWRDAVGCITQESYIYSESIQYNITGQKGESINFCKYLKAIENACLAEFIESLPFKSDTILGANGLTLSKGQKQKILIARLIYKDPQFIFLDEATNGLDSDSELFIMENLKRLFYGRTMLIVAHRLSTIKHADNIFVLKNGKIVEKGKHEDLLNRKGEYYGIIKSQITS